MSAPAKGRADHLDLGSWNVTCGQCGRKRKAFETKQLPAGVPGAGLYVCYPEHWDSRHPQEFVRAVPDMQSVPFAQPPVDVVQFSIAATASGSGNAIALTPAVTLPTGAPFPGMIFQFTAIATNTGAVTAQLVGGIAATVYDQSGSELEAGAIISSRQYYLTFNGLNNSWTLGT